VDLRRAAEAMKVEVQPNDSGIAWELYCEPSAPMWELLPIKVDGSNGGLLADMYHIKEPGTWSGWVEIDGERISVDGFHGGRDRTFGLRVADEIDFWLWLDAGFEDRAIEAWVFETSDGTVTYVDGGITHSDGTLSKRFAQWSMRPSSTAISNGPRVPSWSSPTKTASATA
jgi:hypothetical protein